MKQAHFRAVAVAIGLVAASGAAGATTYNFADFSDLSAWQQNGATASITDPVTDSLGRKVLRLTNSLSQSGSAFINAPISLASDVSFSAAFTFRISNPLGISDGDGIGADGIVFVVQTVSSTAGGGGGGIGYQGLANSVGVEFDTWDNGGGFNDPNGNHVGIDIGGAFNGPTATVATRMNNGSDWYAWVDYNGATDVVELRLATTNARPASPFLTRAVDLTGVLGSTSAFIGFTSGTGAAGGFHDIINFTFEDTYKPIDVPGGGSKVPEPGTLLLLAGGLLGLARIRRR
jgi:hypothetical protein